MKRIIAIFICLLAVVVSVSAQSPKGTSDHLKFMGIPITGTINHFQQKLIAKGCKISDRNKYASAGKRMFSGSFSGEQAEICIFYDRNTKIVYRAKAILLRISKNTATDKYDSFKYKLTQKYGSGYIGENDGYESIYFISSDPSTNTPLGSIDLFITKDDTYLLYPLEYGLHIDYHDYQNSQKHEQSDIDEL